MDYVKKIMFDRLEGQTVNEKVQNGLKKFYDAKLKYFTLKSKIFELKMNKEKVKI